MVLATAEQMRALDRAAIEDFSVPSLELMENAAAAAAKALNEMVPPKSHLAVFCGTGNNGGDGFAASRLLKEMGHSVRTFILGNPDKMTADAFAMAQRLDSTERFSPDCTDYVLRCSGIIDALFGIGLCREITGAFAEAIALINRAPCPVVACDIPSGVHADTGTILGCAVKADKTVTFTFGKPGLFTEPGSRCAGTVEIADIGIPQILIEKMIDKSL